MDFSDILKQVAPHIPGLLIGLITLATTYFAGRSLIQQASDKKEVARLNAESKERDAEAARHAAEAARQQADAERGKLFNTMAEGYMRRADNQDAEIRDLRGKLDKLGDELEAELKQRDIVRTQHEQELDAERAKLEAAKAEWAIEREQLKAQWQLERDRMQAEIDDLNRRLKVFEGKRATPTTEFPAVGEELRPTA